MVTIDKLDWTVYDGYARRMRSIQETNKQLRLDQASSIPPQTQLVDIQPRVAEMDLLFGMPGIRQAHWGAFKAPEVGALRRSPFTTSLITPSFGSLEAQEAEKEKLLHYTCSSKEESRERQTLLNMAKKRAELNGELLHVRSRMAQFLQA